MKKNLNINAIRNGKKVSKSLGFVNPDVANSLVGGFAQMVNGLTNDTFVNAEVVKVMDTTEEDGSGQQSGGSTKQEPTLTITFGELEIDGADAMLSGTYEYNGDGDVYLYYQRPDNADYPAYLNRADKEFYLESNNGSALGNLTVVLHATEGTNYAAKTVSATFHANS